MPHALIAEANGRRVAGIDGHGEHRFIARDGHRPIAALEHLRPYAVVEWALRRRSCGTGNKDSNRNQARRCGAASAL